MESAITSAASMAAYTGTGNDFRFAPPSGPLLVMTRGRVSTKHLQSILNIDAYLRTRRFDGYGLFFCKGAILK